MNRFWKEVIFILLFALIMTLMTICIRFMWDFGVRSMFPNLPEMPYKAAVAIVWCLLFISAGMKFCVKIFEGREDDDE